MVRTVEVYIDDIVVKSETWAKHAQHLEVAFHLIRAYKMKLNLTKCAFGVSARKFLGFMVTQRGIEVNPTQVKAILKTPAPNDKKELQRLTGRLPALRRFIACFTDKLRLFFLILRGASTFGRKNKCEQTFGAVKRYLTESSVLSSPRFGKELYMCLVVLEYAVNVALFR